MTAPPPTAAKQGSYIASVFLIEKYVEDCVEDETNDSSSCGDT